uniref:HTH psq-type domain-containing protein n=1 Tax=Ditylenchus dipsaci TaxID=166011 RepID=A0A915EKB8_9BILA
MVNRKRHRNNDSATKLESIKLARKNSMESAAKKFDVTSSRIQECIKQEDELKHQQRHSRWFQRKRLDGGGRQVNNPDLDVHLAEWIGQGREMAKDGMHDIEEAFQEKEDREQELRININANFEDIVNDDELLFWEELSFD